MKHSGSDDGNPWWYYALHWRFDPLPMSSEQMRKVLPVALPEALRDTGWSEYVRRMDELMDQGLDYQAARWALAYVAVAFETLERADSERRFHGRRRASKVAAAIADTRRRAWLKFRLEVRNERKFASKGARVQNVETDRRTARWLTEQGDRVTQKTIANQRSKYGWNERGR